MQQLPRPWQQLPPILAGLTRGDDPAKLARNFNRTRAELRSAVVALAVQRFRQAEHRSPERADDLVPRYLPYFAPRPADPFDGQPLRWRRLKDGLVIYSVGPDRQDDGGNLDRKNPDRPGSDLGFQLRDGAAGQAVKD